MIQADEKMVKADLLLAQAIMPCLKKGAGNVDAPGSECGLSC